MARIKKGDQVVVITGKDKGTRGQVLAVLPGAGRVIVEGVNRVKRHQKPMMGRAEGGIFEREAPIDISNVMNVDSKTDQRTRVRAGTDKDDRKVRVAVRSGAVLDK